MSESSNKNEDQLNRDEILKAEKEEEAKLKAKYPTVRPGPLLLQKRMQKGVIILLLFFLKSFLIQIIKYLLILIYSNQLNFQSIFTFFF